MIQLNDKQIEYIKLELNSVDTETMYREMLHETYGEVSIAGYEYDVAHALEQIDPTAFRVGLADYEGTLDESDYTEIDGSYYRDDEIETALEKMELGDEAG